MKRLNLFVKGNLDVRDSLHSLRLGGELRWNGINTLARERDLGLTIRVRHETAIGSAALARATGEIPEVFAGRSLPLEPYTLAAQYGDALFAAAADAYVLSIQSDVQMSPVRHRREGFLFQPYAQQSWSPDDTAWLRSEFEAGHHAAPTEAMADLETVVGRLRAASDAPILVYNMSSVVPDETVHCHAGMEDILSTRIRQFNLALIELSQRSGISIIDVDRLVAAHGQQAMKLDTTHLTEHGCRVVAGEVLRVLADLGCLAGTEALP